MVTGYERAMRLDGRLFVVLGAGPGIGCETARALIAFGAQVVCVARRRDPLVALANEIGAVAEVCDAAEPDDLRSLFSRLGRRPEPLGGVVNVIGRGVPTSASEPDLDGWRWQVDNVLTSAVLTIQIGGASLAAAGGGSIVLVGSIAARRVIGDQALFAYSAAKAALEQMARAGAVELGPAGVRVNVVSPGLTMTPRVIETWSPEQLTHAARVTPLGRIAEPPDVAAAIAFLSSDLARHVTGHSLAVDGGLGALAPNLGSPTIRAERNEQPRGDRDDESA
jgi:NAD(P)-dependent dehydrogenase (short-subunit alcohol dehydrogenase family)